MRRIAERAGLGRRVAPSALALATGLALAAPAVAGDRAGLGFIGYSGDGRYFAFEEYGIQDGSGFAYANVYVLDLDTDTWVKGAPVKVVVEEDSAAISAARTQALGQARAMLAQYAVSEPVDILALIGDGVADADYSTLEAGWPSYGMEGPQNGFELSLETFEAEGKPECATYSEEPMQGFALTVTQEGASREAHRDVRVPNSRGCVQGYRLYGVVAPFGYYARPDDTSLYGVVAIVGVYTLGFEGPDRRFLAVPLAR